MKFSFATAFLTLTAASAVVFAAPAQDDNSSATSEIVPGPFDLGGSVIKGQVNGMSLFGNVDEGVTLPVLSFNPAIYVFNSISDLNGPFQGHINDNAVSITCNGGKATITGTANEGSYSGSLDFKGNANLFGN